MPLVVTASVHREVPLNVADFSPGLNRFFFLNTEENLSPNLHHTLKKNRTWRTVTSMLGAGAAGKPRDRDFGVLQHKLKCLSGCFVVTEAVGLYMTWVRMQINVSHLIFLLSTSCLEHRACPSHGFVFLQKQH